MEGMYFFSQAGFKWGNGPQDISKIGVRGERILELIDINLPIPPGIIIESTTLRKINDKDINLVIEYVKEISKITGRRLGNPDAPLFLKLVVSPDLKLVKFPGIRFIGINDEVFDILKERIDEKFAYIAYCTFLEEMARLGAEYRPEVFFSLPQPDDLKDLSLDKLKERLRYDKEGIEKNIPFDLEERIVYVFKQISAIASMNSDVEMGALLQDMVLGNYSEDSFTGYFYTRNIIDGSPNLYGKFFIKNYFIDDDSKGMILRSWIHLLLMNLNL